MTPPRSDAPSTTGRPGPLGWAAAAGLVAAGAIVAAQASGVAAAVLGPEVDAAMQLADHRQRVGDYAARVDAQLTQIAGRSMFFLPPEPPPPPKPKPKPKPPGPKKDPGPPPPPSSYAGPDVIVMMGDVVWFEGGVRVPVGGEHDGATVITTDPPWTATLGWRGAEFDVELFDRTTPRFLVEPEASAAGAAGAADPPEPAPQTPSDPDTIPSAGEPDGDDDADTAT